LDVLAAHAPDLWGIALVTVGILSAIALYGGTLGPVGHEVRLGAGMVLGVGRFLVPPACVVAGVLVVVGRQQREPVRALLGMVLALWAFAGLADLAGGSPRFSFHTKEASLSRAGGWLGALVGAPLREGLSGVGAAIVLVMLLAVALLLLTGVTLRQLATGLSTGVLRVKASRQNTTLRVGEEQGAGLEERHAEHPVEDSVVPEAQDPGVAPRAEEMAPVALGHVESGVEPGADRDIEPDVKVPGEHSEVHGAAKSARGPKPRGGSGDQLELDLAVPAGNWKLPPLKLLSRSTPQKLDQAEVAAAGKALVDALRSHGVETRLVGHTVGPTVTRFELELGPGVKVARITSLAKDIAYAMASPDVRSLAPIPGKSAIGVEVPNRRRELVTLGDLLTSPEARSATHPLEVALGRDIAGRSVIVNLADMPHLLISGATGAGKSSCINSILTSILMRATPDQVRLILVDPKRVELGQYNGLPHLLTQVVVNPKKAANALAWAVTEMERRYDILAEVGMRDITGYNQAIDRGELATEQDLDVEDFDELPAEVSEEQENREQGRIGGDEVTALEDAEVARRVALRMAESRQAVEPRRTFERLPFILVVVDELNDLMMVAARDVEESVCRIAQMARAVGIHLVLATQRPSVDVITGVIKANVPSRLAFSVSSLADSRVILDQPGAERLIGKGDMLLLTASSSVPRRLQGPWVEEDEVRTAVAHWQRQRPAEYVEGIAAEEGRLGGSSTGDDDDDELLTQAMELVVRAGQGSTSMLQRKLRVGFARAGRLMDLLERRGVVGPSEGSKSRAVLMAPEELEELLGR
jgi:S-DNA-T family DNA segregation ATPase FtsK/SpoIIIE